MSKDNRSTKSQNVDSFRVPRPLRAAMKKQVASNRRLWNQKQRQLRPMLVDARQVQPAIQLLLGQHAMVHSAKLVAGTSQVLHQADWPEQMRITVQDTGNAMEASAIVELNESIDIEALRAYRLAVGRRTRQIVQGLSAEALSQKVDPTRLQQIMEEGAVAEVSRGLLDYWGRRTMAGLLLMPASRHNFIHLNEALRLREIASKAAA